MDELLTSKLNKKELAHMDWRSKIKMKNKKINIEIPKNMKPCHVVGSDWGWTYFFVNLKLEIFENKIK